MAGHLQQGGAGSPPAHLPPPAQGKQLPATRARTAALAEATVGICKCSVKNKKIKKSVNCAAFADRFSFSNFP